MLTDGPGARWHGDVRLLRLWVRLAHEQQQCETHQFFHSLEEQQIGIKHALLYETWAAALELKKQFAAADAVYERGVKRRAQPLARLERNYSDFKDRMARR